MKLGQAGTILRNVASNWAGFAVNAVVTLALTPFVLRTLGPSAYGIWILTSSVVGYYGFLDLGFRAGVTQYLARYLAQGDGDRASDCMSTSVAALATLGVFLAVLSVGVALALPLLFTVPEELLTQAAWCVLIVGISSAIQLALSPFTSVLAATQRFDLANAIGITTRLMGAGAIVAALARGHGLVGISLVTCGTSIADYAIRWWVARRIAPGLEISRKRISMDRLREVSSFGAWNFFMSLNAFVYQHVPNILIGLFMPVAAVGRYALSVGLSRQINSVVGPIGQVIYPAAAAMDVRGDRRGLERLYHDGSRLMMLVTSIAVVVTFFWAEDFYRLWVGQQYIAGTDYPSVALIFQVLLLSTVTNFSNIGGQILMGAGRVRIVAMTQIVGSVLNLGLSLALFDRFGLLGMAMAVVVASFIVDLVAMPVLVERHLGLSVVRLVTSACGRPLVSAVLQVAGAVGIRAMGEVGGWLDLMIQMGAAVLVSALVVVTIGVTRDERARFVTAPLRRLLRPGPR